jgi:hypothetical protein
MNNCTDYSDSFTQFSQDSDIDIFDCLDPDSEIYEPDMSDSFSNSDDGQMSANEGGGGYDDEDDDNEDWAVCDENNHDFYTIIFLVINRLETEKSLFLHTKSICYFLVQLHLKK